MGEFVLMSPNTISVESRLLHFWWPFVHRGLEAVRRKTKPEWLSEDVYSALRTGSALLLMAMCGQTPVGFTISYIADIPFSGKKELFVWVAWTIPPRERHPDWPVEAAIAHNFDFLVNLARQGGASRLSCLSPRPGFAKWSAKFGFKPTLHTYVRELA